VIKTCQTQGLMAIFSGEGGGEKSLLARFTRCASSYIA